MSKTNEMYLDKARSLIKGLKEHLETVKDYGISKDDIEGRLHSMLPEVNKALPNYAQIRKIEFIENDFERTPKRSIKRYLYQRNK